MASANATNILALSSSMFFESKRLETFKNAPSLADARMIAEAGFYYQSGYVKCYFCDLEIEERRLKGDARKMHEGENENCPLGLWQKKKKKSMTVEDALQLEYERKLLKIEREYDSRIQDYTKSVDDTLSLFASKAMKRDKNGVTKF